MKRSAVRLVAAAALGFLLAPAPAPAAAPAGRYTASAGVVKDTKTGLYWQQTEAPITYTFADAMTYCSGNAAGLPGAGWRLPAIKELLTLVDDSVGSPGPTIDASVFPATPASSFWSTTLFGGSPVCVFFGAGTGYPQTPTSLLYVRCVR